MKGRRLKLPVASNIRPSTDKLREAVFSILGDDIIGIGVADLFCGSGILGIEALSRGADFALFVDSAAGAISNLKKNLGVLGILEQSTLKKKDAMKLGPALLEGISIILADPPYNRGYCDNLIALLCLPKFDWNGIIMLEHESGWKYDGREMNVLNRKSYGDSAVSFLRKKS